VIAAVHGRVEVLMDGGIRRALTSSRNLSGARAFYAGEHTLMGWPFGEAGVTRALEILRADVERTLRMLGALLSPRWIGSYVSALQTGEPAECRRKTHLPQRTASRLSEGIASLQFENASHTNCVPDNSWNIYARQTRQLDRNDGRLHTGGLRCAAINTRSGHELIRFGELGRRSQACC